MKVKIKSWEELEKEFGYDNEDTLRTPSGFTQLLEEDLPADRIIEVVGFRRQPQMWLTGDGGVYYIDEEMVSEVIDDSLPSVTTRLSMMAWLIGDMTYELIQEMGESQEKVIQEVDGLLSVATDLANTLDNHRERTLTVRIKSMDKMRKEFGQTPGGSIAVSGGFNSTMEAALPDNRIITISRGEHPQTDKEEDSIYYWRSPMGSTFLITQGMIELKVL